MGWKNVAAGLGTQAAVSGLKTARSQMSKRELLRATIGLTVNARMGWRG